MQTHLALLLALASSTLGYITVDYSCTKYTANFVYDESATSCLNGLVDRTCETLFEKEVNVAQYPFPGRNDARPTKCFSSDKGITLDDSMKAVAIQLCPKTCGFCCKIGPHDSASSSWAKKD